MSVFLFRNGNIVDADEAGVCEPWDCALIEGEEGSYTVIPLEEGVYVVREGSQTHVQLVIFKQGGRQKPRVMKFHDIPANISIWEVVQLIFAKLLSFDNNRLANRDRNIAITIVRSHLPTIVQGVIEREKGNLNFHLYNNLLSVFRPNGNCATRLGYASFSRAIKDCL